MSSSAGAGAVGPVDTGPATGMLHAYCARRIRPGLPRRFDEMVGFSGRIRPGWRELTAAAKRLGPEGLAAAAGEADRLLAEDGVTHRALDGADEQRWPLDPLPLFLDEGEWAVLEHGLAQRAELLDRLAADLYGPRRTIVEGILPVEIVHAHPGFLRTWDGVVPTGARQVLLAAADLARSAEGAWCVLADRVRAPSGPGYAMVNRRVVSRVLPDLYRRAEIHRLGPFFHAMRLGCEQAAPASAESPRVVLLSAGAAGPNAYEQAFLSAALGHPLVRGEDLLAADGRVWLRTLGRLEPVDVVLCRLDHCWADPLDLRPDSELGVPGLIEAARAGTVRVLNGLGTAVLENPALAPFLPALARRLLDEPLRLRSVPTYWCGEPDGRRRVLAELDTLVLKPLAGAPAIFGGNCSAAERAELRARIEAAPHAWVGQEMLARSTAPAVVGDDLRAREVTLRTFAVAVGSRWSVLTGGLAQVIGGAAASAVRPEPATTKDVWIPNTRGAPGGQPWVREVTPSQVLPITTSPRVLENMFRLGRYAERAEDTARLLRTVLDRWSDFHSSPETSGARALGVLLIALTEVTATGPGFPSTLIVPAEEFTSLVLDEQRPGTLADAVHGLTSAAGEVREQLSTDTWLVLGNLERELAARRGVDPGEPGRNVLAAGLPATVVRVLEGLLALSGLIAESLVRDVGWQFCEIGRRIERARHVVELLAATLCVERDGDSDSLVLESVLIAAESIITYRRRYAARAGVATALDLLLTDRENPRSVAFGLDRLGEALDRVPADPARIAAARTTLTELRTRVREATTTALAAADSAGQRAGLRRLLEELSVGLGAVAAQVQRGFFVHAAPQRPLEAVSFVVSP